MIETKAEEVVFFSACARYHEDLWADELYEHRRCTPKSAGHYSMFVYWAAKAKAAADELRRLVGSNATDSVKQYCRAHAIPFDKNEILYL